MAILALVVLSGVTLLGLFLLGAALRGASPGAGVRAAHGLLAMLGVGLTVATAFASTAKPEEALWLLGAAFVAGMVLWLFWDSLRALRGAVIALHGMLGLAAFFWVAGWVLGLR